MSKTGENIYKRKDGRWEGRYKKGRTESGAIRYGYVYARTYRETKEKLINAAALIKNMDKNDEGVQNCLPGEKQKNVREIGNIWIGTQKQSVKESTYIKYHSILKTYIIPHLGETQMQHLTQDSIENFLKTLLKTGGSNIRTLAPKTVADIFSVLRRIIAYASKEGISVPCDPSEIRIRHPKKEICILSIREQKQLCEYLYRDKDQRSLGILLCIFTGLRIGELCALTMEDISMEEKLIFVHQTMQRIQIIDEAESQKKTKVIITPPKSNSSIRYIPLPDELVKILKERRLPENGFFLTGKADQYCEPRAMQLYFRKVLKRCALRLVNFHVCRHTFATRCVELGFDVKTLSEILGHSSVTITMDRYVHPTMDLKRENMDRLSNLINVR